MKTRWQCTAVVGLAVAISACSSHQAVLENASIHDQQALASLRTDDGDLDRALVGWSSAINALEPGENAYFHDERYIERARFASNQALAQLLWDQPREARQTYISALDQLKGDVERHRDVAKSFNENIEMFSMAAAMVGTGLFAYYASSMNPTASPAQTQALSQSALDVGKAIYDLGALDWAGLERIRDHSPNDLEIDFIRMPFFAHYHEMAAIGRLLPRWCTVSLVGHRLALTNAHCVHNGQRFLLANELTLEFDKLGAVRHRKPDKSAYNAGGSFSVVAVHVSPDWVPSAVNRYSGTDCGRDWALLELGEHPEGIDFFEVRPDLDFRSDDIRGVYRRDAMLGGGHQYTLVADQLAVGGYSADLNRGSFITLDYGCPIEWLEPSIGYKCATAGGSSGSPILMANGPYRLNTVVGVNACGTTKLAPDTWRTYFSRDDIIDTALGTPARRFIPKLMELREKTGTAYLPSGIGLSTEVQPPNLGS